MWEAGRGKLAGAGGALSQGFPVFSTIAAMKPPVQSGKPSVTEAVAFKPETCDLEVCGVSPMLILFYKFQFTFQMEKALNSITCPLCVAYLCVHACSMYVGYMYMCISECCMWLSA